LHANGLHRHLRKGAKKGPENRNNLASSDWPSDFSKTSDIKRKQTEGVSMLPSQNESQRALKENTAMVSEYLRSVGKIPRIHPFNAGQRVDSTNLQTFLDPRQPRLSLGE
jgi:hypothetical protein